MYYEKHDCPYGPIWFRCNIDIDESEADRYIRRGLDEFGSELQGINAWMYKNDVELEYLVGWKRNHTPFCEIHDCIERIFSEDDK